MTRQINFDMDGTIANLYGVEGWLDMLRAYDATPYEEAAPMLNLSTLARTLNKLQRAGWKLNVISWLSKNSTLEYDKAVTKAKEKWLALHLKSVKWDKISIVPYGTPKETLGTGILFDDEKQNRDNWRGLAYDEKDILNILKGLK